MWTNPRVHLTLETDASIPAELSRVVLPPVLDIIIDDGSHRFLDQEATLHTLWPRLRPGGFYVIEDMLVGALPWDSEHAKQVPSQNTNCGVECFFPQKIAEHPFMFDRFGHLKGPSARSVTLSRKSIDLLSQHDWFWVVTGVHQGGGLDCSMVIRKSGPSIASSSAIFGKTDHSALEAAQHQVELVAQQQSELQSKQADLAAKLQLARSEAKAALASREVECQSAVRTDHVAAHSGSSDSSLWTLLALSVVLNVVLLLRRQR